MTDSKQTDEKLKGVEAQSAELHQPSDSGNPPGFKITQGETMPDEWKKTSSHDEYLNLVEDNYEKNGVKKVPKEWQPGFFDPLMDFFEDVIAFIINLPATIYRLLTPKPKPSKSDSEQREVVSPHAVERTLLDGDPILPTRRVEQDKTATHTRGTEQGRPKRPR